MAGDDLKRDVERLLGKWAAEVIQPERSRVIVLGSRMSQDLAEIQILIQDVETSGGPYRILTFGQEGVVKFQDLKSY
jgi:hypothetical protein